VIDQIRGHQLCCDERHLNENDQHLIEDDRVEDDRVDEEVAEDEVLDDELVDDEDLQHSDEIRMLIK
jgi:hypothetical protein